MCPPRFPVHSDWYNIHILDRMPERTIYLTNGPVQSSPACAGPRPIMHLCSRRAASTYIRFPPSNTCISYVQQCYDHMYIFQTSTCFTARDARSYRPSNRWKFQQWPSRQCGSELHVSPSACQGSRAICPEDIVSVRFEIILKGYSRPSSRLPCRWRHQRNRPCIES